MQEEHVVEARQKTIAELEIEEFQNEGSALLTQANVTMQMEDEIRQLTEALKKRHAHIKERVELMETYKDDPKGWCEEIQRRSRVEVRNIFFQKVKELYESGLPSADFSPCVLQRPGGSDSYGTFTYELKWYTLLEEIGGILDVINQTNDKCSYRIKKVIPPWKKPQCLACGVHVEHTCRGSKGVVQVEQGEPLDEEEKKEVKNTDPALAEELARLKKDLSVQVEGEQEESDEEEQEFVEEEQEQ